jgi:hypothetical protein
MGNFSNATLGHYWFDPINVDPFRSVVDPIENTIIARPDTIAIIPC